MALKISNRGGEVDVRIVKGAGWNILVTIKNTNITGRSYECVMKTRAGETIAEPVCTIVNNNPGQVTVALTAAEVTAIEQSLGYIRLLETNAGVVKELFYGELIIEDLETT